MNTGSRSPDYVAMFRGGIAQLAGANAICCWLHSASGMISRAAEGSFSGISCRGYASAAEKRLDGRLAEEAATR